MAVLLHFSLLFSRVISLEVIDGLIKGVSTIVAGQELVSPNKICPPKPLSAWCPNKTQLPQYFTVTSGSSQNKPCLICTFILRPQKYIAPTAVVLSVWDERPDKCKYANSILLYYRHFSASHFYTPKQTHTHTETYKYMFSVLMPGSQGVQTVRCDHPEIKSPQIRDSSGYQLISNFSLKWTPLCLTYRPSSFFWLGR